MKKYTKAYDKGICEFCGQPIEYYEPIEFIRLETEYFTRVAHEDCYEQYLKEQERGDDIS